MFDFGVCGFKKHSEIYLIGGKTVNDRKEVQIMNLIYLYKIEEDHWTLFDF